MTSRSATVQPLLGAASPIPWQRVLILDDDADARLLLADCVRAVAPEANIDECEDLADFRAQAPQALTGLYLIDLGLPDGDGVDAVRWLHARRAPGLIVVASSRSDQQSILSALSAGASGYLCKYDDPVDLRRALAVFHAGGSMVSPAIAAQLIGLARSLPASRPKSGLTLTERELEILTLASKGCTFPQVAELTGTKVCTVYTHVRHIYDKLSVSNLPQALFEARNLGWL